MKCQACKPEDKGCPICGGYKVVLVEYHCKCGRTCWFRPGMHTMYEGKRYHSFDGLEWVSHASGDNCIYCEEKK